MPSEILKVLFATGEGDEEESVTVEFPVQGTDGIVMALRGTLIRQNRDYYLQINTILPEDRDAFLHRIVLVTLTDPVLNEPLLQRRVDIGVTVMLGTELRLSEESHLEAVLLPKRQRRR